MCSSVCPRSSVSCRTLGLPVSRPKSCSTLAAVSGILGWLSMASLRVATTSRCVARRARWAGCRPVGEQPRLPQGVRVCEALDQHLGKWSRRSARSGTGRPGPAATPGCRTWTGPPGCPPAGPRWLPHREHAEGQAQGTPPALERRSRRHAGPGDRPGPVPAWGLSSRSRITAGTKVRLNPSVTRIPTAVNTPKMRMGSMSITTNDSSPRAVAVSTVGRCGRGLPTPQHRTAPGGEPGTG